MQFILIASMTKFQDAIRIKISFFFFKSDLIGLDLFKKKFFSTSVYRRVREPVAKRPVSLVEKSLEFRNLDRARIGV